MFKKIGIVSICIFVIALFFLRRYQLINNVETLLLTVTCLMLLIFSRYLFLRNK